jgi:hypothetical protein
MRAASADHFFQRSQFWSLFASVTVTKVAAQTFQVAARVLGNILRASV